MTTTWWTTSKSLLQNATWITIARRTTNKLQSQDEKRITILQARDKLQSHDKRRANETGNSPLRNTRQITIVRQKTSKLLSQNKRRSTLARQIKLQSPIKWNNYGNNNLGEHCLRGQIFLSNPGLSQSLIFTANWRKRQEFFHELHKSWERIS